jgi:D-Tyr-tRNAtyr deacylase
LSVDSTSIMSSPPPPPPPATTTTTHGKGGASNNKPKAAQSSSFGVSLVFQRFRSCELLLNNAEWVRVGHGRRRRRCRGRQSDAAAATTTTATESDECHDTESNSDNEPSQQQQHCGLLVYVSFSRHATPDCALQAAHTIVNLPLLTEGVWGDGVSKTFGALNHQQHDLDVDRSIVLVPQANLICKVKQQGRSVQYHGQASFAQGQELYLALVQHVRHLVNEHCGSDIRKLRGEGESQGAATAPVTGAQEDRWSSSEVDATSNAHPLRRPVEVVAGTFGTRQGLTIESDMGPFCHVVNL